MNATGNMPAGAGRPAPSNLPSFAATVTLGLLVGLTLLAGCESTAPSPNTAAPPPPRFTGPPHLYGTVGSLVKLNGAEPILVSGYGLVVNLDGTGSSEVPEFLRTWLINEIRRGGIGSARLNTQGLSPEQLLADLNTSIVAVQGFIPPGSPAGTRFDVLVSALPETQTTSLEGGVLWTVNMSVDGLNPSMRYVAPMAKARGEVYLNPLDEKDPDGEQGFQIAQRAVVIGGGEVTESRRIELVLNQRSISMARAVANRINTRFPKAPRDREHVAEAKTDMIIKLNIPRSYVGRERELLALVNHTYVQTGPGFVQTKAQTLGEVLTHEIAAMPDRERAIELANDIALAWHALGRTCLPQVRAYYGHADPLVRLTAVEAGARLGDGQTITHIQELTRHPEPAVRARLPWIAVRLPRSPAMTHTLRTLLDDDEQRVRIVTYEALAEVGDGMVNRVPVGGIDGRKFVIDLVPSSRPLVYVSQNTQPRLVVFSPNAGFKQPMYASIWNGRLRLRSSDGGDRVDVFYQRPTGASKVFSMAPTVANLALLLAQPASVQNPNEAPNLTYGHVVNAIHSLHEMGWLAADMRIEQNRLATAVDKALKAPPVEVRPESAGLARGYGALTDPDAVQPEAALAANDRAATNHTTASAAPSFVRGDTRPGPAADPGARRVLAPSIAPEAARQQEVAPEDLPPAQETYLIPAEQTSPAAEQPRLEGPRAGG